MNDRKKSILTVLTRSPYGGATAREALDAILTAAAFEVPVSLLFMDDAVYQLLPDQHPEAIAAKDLSSTLPVLPMYDVENIFVDRLSLTQRGMDPTQLILGVTAVEGDALRALFQDHDRILSF